MSTASWTGIRLSELMKAVELSEEAAELVFEGVDGGPSATPSGGRRCFGRSLPRSLLSTEPNLLVALEMNGAPLPREHGFPARLIVPGWYAMASVKWLSRIIAVREPFRGHYQHDRYVYVTTQDGKEAREPVTRMGVKSILVSPSEGAVLRVGQPATLRGKAWSGEGPVRSVEVDVGEGGGWFSASLGPELGPYAWRSWEASWVPRSAGVVTIRSRAVDASGRTQPELPVPNQRQYGCNSIQSVRVRVE